MNPFDIVICVVLVYCLIRGIFRGLVKEISSLVGVLAGFWAGYTYYGMLARPLAQWISNPAYRSILGFILIFSAVFILISLLGVIMRYLLSIVFLGWVDRISGALFGLLKGVLITSVLLLVFTAFLPKNSPLVQDSLLSPHLMRVSEQMAKALSSDMKFEFSHKLKEIKKRWQEGPA
jgi:membrane protein required for colicin V production